jgi:nicotinate-nucleotide adenylyltransferase
VPAMAISSTDCRARVADGEPVWYLVPDGVVQYINKYHLYAADLATTGSAPSQPGPQHALTDALPQGDS